jgi:uncharacterized protein
VSKVITLIALIICSAPIGICQDIESIATDISQHLTDNKIGKVHKTFSKKTKKAFKKVYLNAAWKSIKKNNGKLVNVGKPSFSSLGGKSMATIPMDFEEASFNLVVTTNDLNEINGFRFTALEYETPAWAKNQVFGKERLYIETDTLKLPGELILPETCNQCPVVILVHGSGPSDMNEGSSMSPNRLFLDLAYGFALNGIATIRYDKRTLKYPKQMSGLDSFTIYDETINDAVSAIRKSKEYSFLDSSRIYVLGHSLGAYASPLIAQEANEIKGIVMLAGPYRPLHEIIPEQYAYIFGLDGDLSKREKKILSSVREEVKFINEETSTVSRLKVLGNNKMLPYFRQMNSYNPTVTLKNLSCRVLIAQGDRDYNVRHETEYNAYKSQLSNSNHIDFKLIPGANHQLIWGTKPSVPAEYIKPGHPSIKVIEDIADWILEK